MDLDVWANQIAEAFKAECGDRGRFEALYALPNEFNKEAAENAVLISIHEQMPNAAVEVWVDGHSKLNVRKHLT